ncbi:hypothetical protein RFI_11575 [Reticulomyxa filosa]|uniref:Uncharacterized protein n=1 Tax=Reticulomyxa filosa TaxID=46433 RepID=X6NIK9_RETFI|nr:hypothetical protein RFI_11575 [Reticulomyxa filosa]|eukprot:ETO25559.1 hypothetical protein RFI_11575 [Reticulomyxa filosa]
MLNIINESSEEEDEGEKRIKEEEEEKVLSTSVETFEYVCPERRTYDFLVSYFEKNRNKEAIELSLLHHLMHENEKTVINKEIKDDIKKYGIAGTNKYYPWRKRGMIKYKNFVESIPGLEYKTDEHNNLLISIKKDNNNNNNKMNEIFEEIEKEDKEKELLNKIKKQMIIE